MTRSLSQTLKDGLANGQGNTFYRVLTWNDLADYDANPDDPDHVWTCLKAKIDNTSATCTLVTENDYVLSDFTVFIIERGLLISGTEYPVQSGLMFVENYTETYGIIKLEGSSYPNQKISIAAGDGTYQEVIEAFCDAIGKTAVFKNDSDPWLDYQFLPDGKSLVLNKAKYFESLLKQKYTILVYEESPGNLVFYNQDSYFIPNKEWYGLTWSPDLGLLCAVGYNVVATSPDGNNWTNGTIPETYYDIQWNDICWSSELGLFCAVGIPVDYEEPDIIMTSPDGLDWTLQTASGYAELQEVCWAAALGLFCAIASSGEIMTSPDGETWTEQADIATYPFSIAWSPELGLFCIVGYPGLVMTSPDGTNWTTRTPAEANNWRSVCWSPELGLFCAVAIAGTHRVQTSSNGIDWTAHTAAEANNWLAVCWSPELSLFVALSGTGTNRVQYSSNGADWTAHSSAQANTWTSIVWSPQLAMFVAVSYTGVMRSLNGIDWIAETLDADWNLDYQAGPNSSIVRDQSGVHYLWRDENNTIHTQGDTDLPQWNLGFLPSTSSPPTTWQDPYYKYYLQKAPVRLDITDSDKIHFIPYWSIDPTKTIDAMCQVVEIFDPSKSPSWYQEIRSIILFDKTEGGALPSTIERVAAYTPLVTTNFDGILDETVNNLQALADRVDDHNHGASVPDPTATNDFLLGAQVDGVWSWVKYTLAQAVTALRASLDSVYVPKVSANRPGVYRLYRRDADNDYSLQHYWTGSYWRLDGYAADTYHAPVYVGYADVADYAYRLLRATIYHSTTQTIAHNTWTTVYFNSEVNDDWGWHDPVTNNFYLWPTTGEFQIILQNFAFASNATGVRGVKVVDYFGNTWSQVVVPAISGYDTPLVLTAQRATTAGYPISVQVFQTSGGNLNLQAYCKLTAVRIG